MDVVTRVRAVLVAVVLLALSHGASAQQQGVRVQVLLTGRAPKVTYQSRKTSEPLCALRSIWLPEEDVLVSASGGIRNAVVFVSRNAPPGGQPRDAELNHQGCTYKPRVLGMSANGTLRVANNDQIAHNVHIYRGVKTLLNEQQPVGGTVVSRQFADQAGGFLRVRCDLHPWEMSFVVVTPSQHFGVTGENGDVTLTELPPGTYTLTAFHERFGFKTAEVTVGPDGRGDVKILYDGNEPRP